MVAIADLSALIGAVAVAAGVTVAIFQLRHFHALRRLDVVVRLYSTFGEESFQRNYWRVMNWDYKSFEDFDGRAQTDDYVAWFVVGVFFENMGLLLKRGLAKIDLLDDLLSGPIIQSWEKTEPITVGYRKKHSKPQIVEWYEYLYKAMKKRLIELGEER